MKNRIIKKIYRKMNKKVIKKAFCGMEGYVRNNVD
jgi:hypothetical protein